ncbi:MAG: AmmeMemoRadiSam system protein A [Bacilli bacterium]|nr:AmmeMemoRadiSam system protein A [Bacilli bacterium]
MKDILGFYLMPHPPISVPEVGDNREIRATVDACLAIGKEIKEKAPQTIIVITPHGVMFSDAIAISFEDTIYGDLGRFRARNVKIEKAIDLELAQEIALLAEQDDISVAKINTRYLSDYNHNYELDHGTIVPLYFIEKEYRDYRLVHITYGLLGSLDLYRFGMMIKEAVWHLNRDAVIIASGDLSHRLTKSGPYPYSPQGKVFDETLIGLLEKGDTVGIFTMSPDLIEEAGECGLRSVYILLGSLAGSFHGRRLSYEGPFGVGYGVMSFSPVELNQNVYPLLKAAMEKKRKAKKANSNDYVRLARMSLEYYFKHRKKMPVPADCAKELKERQAGVFVSLKKYGNLRGCIGTFMPTQDSIAMEIIENAISAAMRDPRFPSVREAELDDLDISVDVLSLPESARKEDLDPKNYGVIVSKGYKRGLLLPDLEGVDTVTEQLRIACSKAGIAPDGDYDIERFKVVRYQEGK